MSKAKTTRKCGRCGEVKPLTEFHKFRHAISQAYCKVCAKEYAHLYREFNKEKINARRKEKYRAMKLAYDQVNSEN